MVDHGHAGQDDRELKFLVALRPGLVSRPCRTDGGDVPAAVEGRVLLNVVTGGEPHEQQAYGDFLDKDQRYVRTGEFLDVVSRLWNSPDPVTFDGEYIRVKDAQLGNRPDPVPPIFFGGSSATRRARLPPGFPTPISRGESRRRSRQEGRVDCRTCRRVRPETHLRIADPRHHPGHRGRGVGGRRPSAGRYRSRGHRTDAGQSSAQRVRGQRRMAEYTGVERIRWRSPRTCGPASGWYVAAQGTALVGSHEEVAARIVEYSGWDRSLHPVRLSPSGRGVLVR